MTTWVDDVIQQSLCHGTLEIDSIPMTCPAWTVTNVYVLWQPAPARGENLGIGGMPGRYTMPRRRDEVQRTLEMVVTGTCDQSGVKTADPYIGLEVNLAYLNDNVFSTGDYMVAGTAALTMPSGDVRTGPIQVEEVTYGIELGVVSLVTVNVTLPEGVLKSTGS